MSLRSLETFFKTGNTGNEGPKFLSKREFVGTWGGSYRTQGGGERKVAS